MVVCSRDAKFSFFSGPENTAEYSSVRKLLYCNIYVLLCTAE